MVFFVLDNIDVVTKIFERPMEIPGIAIIDLMSCLDATKSKGRDMAVDDALLYVSPIKLMRHHLSHSPPGH